MRKRASILLILISTIFIGGCDTWQIYDYLEVDVKPEPVYAPKPAYSDRARTAEMEGQVIIEVLVGRDGNVKRAKVQQSSGYDELDKAARDAAKQWEFTPAEKDGEPVRVWVIIPFNFSLREGG